MTVSLNSDVIYDGVHKHYTAAASRTNDVKTNDASRVIANAFGYTDTDLEHLPEGANLGLSCGNPLAIASLREGETVIDLGSGSGFDIFACARRVGPTGRAIGIDMNSAMLSLARTNLQKLNPVPTNVEFVDGRITAVPLEDDSADCIISNCVVNLVPEAEKHLVFAEMGRLLKRGGRVAISDILARQDMGEAVRRDLELYVGCIAGAAKPGQYEGWLRDAGFEDILITDTNSDLNVYKQASDSGCCGGVETKKSCCGSTANDTEPGRGLDMDFNKWAGSYKIHAVKA